MPHTERWYEVFELGEQGVSRGKAMIEPEMVSYALRYDLQPFHIDTVAATGSGVGGSPGSR
jgi:acyl dehydratase